MRQTQRGVAKGDRRTDAGRETQKKKRSPRGRQSEGQRWTGRERKPEERGRGRRPETKIQREVGREQEEGSTTACSALMLGWARGHNSTGLHPRPENLQSCQETDKGRAGRARETFRGQDWAQTWPGTEHLGSWGSG